MVRKFLGRRKLEMKKISNESNLRVSFSKRRIGIFKKASELVTLCGAEIALIVFSPSGKVFSFGHPSIDVLFDRLSGRVLNNAPGNTNPNFTVQSLNQKLGQVLREKEEEEKKKDKYKRLEFERMNKSLNETLQMKQALEDLKKEIDDVSAQFNQTMVPHPNFHVGSSSNVVAPGTMHGGNIYPNQDFFYQNRMMGMNFDPSMMIMPNGIPPFGYNPNNNNVSERFFSDNVMNRIPENNNNYSNPNPGV